MEIESGGVIPFLDVLVIQKEMVLANSDYRKPTHIGQYLNFSFNYPLHMKRSLILSLHEKASTICQEMCNEISSHRRDFQLNGYPEVSWSAVVWAKRISLCVQCIFHM
jgi:hypothetical protein